MFSTYLLSPKYKSGVALLTLTDATSYFPFITHTYYMYIYICLQSNWKHRMIWFKVLLIPRYFENKNITIIIVIIIIITTNYIMNTQIPIFVTEVISRVKQMLPSFSLQETLDFAFHSQFLTRIQISEKLRQLKLSTCLHGANARERTTGWF